MVDLRQPQERAVGGIDRPAWLHSVHVDLDDRENHAFWNEYWDNGLVGTALYYLPHLAAMPERSGAAVAAIVNAPPGGVLFHCVGGRDRTGLVALLLLMAIDTTANEIVADYLETVRVGHLLAASLNRQNGEPAAEAVCRQHGTTTEAAFRDAVAGLEFESWLERACLDGATCRALRTWRGSLS